MLPNSELKKIKRMETTEKWKILGYIVFGISLLIGVFFGSIGIILNEANLKIAGLIAGLPSMMAIISTKRQLKLFRIIKKLQGELEQNQQKNPTTETK